MHRSVRRLLVASLMATGLALGLLATTASASTSAPAAHGARITPTCAQTTVALHGDKPATVTCTRWATPGHVTPDTRMTSCANPARTVDIYDSAGHDTCFTGTGYLAYRITNVTYINSIDWGWVKMYDSADPGGWPEKLRGDGQWYGYPSALITQVCIEC